MSFLQAGEGKAYVPAYAGDAKASHFIFGKPILAHIIDALPACVTELMLVVGNKREMIQEYFGSEYRGKPVLCALSKADGWYG